MGQLLTSAILMPIVMTIGIRWRMKTVSKSLLKAKMLEYFRDIETTGEELTVTSDGVPVLRVVPIKQKRTASDVFSDVRGKLGVHGDILATHVDEWEEV